MASRKLTLNSGILKHLSRLERHGDATVTYEDKKIKIEVGVNFKSLEVSAIDLLLFLSCSLLKQYEKKMLDQYHPLCSYLYRIACFVC